MRLFCSPFICDLVSRVAASVKAATRGRRVEPRVPPPLANELMPRGGVLKIHVMRPVRCTGSIPALVSNGFWDARGSFSPGLGHPLPSIRARLLIRRHQRENGSSLRVTLTVRLPFTVEGESQSDEASKRVKSE